MSALSPEPPSYSPRREPPASPPPCHTPEAKVAPYSDFSDGLSAALEWAARYLEEILYCPFSARRAGASGQLCGRASRRALTVSRPYSDLDYVLLPPTHWTPPSLLSRTSRSPG